MPVPSTPSINNDFYDYLGERWLNAMDDPVALLRAEGNCKQGWVTDRLPTGRLRILDIGCGAGFLLRHLGGVGHWVVGTDLSWQALRVGRGVNASPYLCSNAYRLPFKDASFDVITCMDFLEHVENPAAIIAEACRVLRPEGRFFIHTFNRNPLAYWVIIRGVEWFVKNTPRHMHVLSLFIKPHEVKAYCERAGIQMLAWTGIRPELNWAFFKMIVTRVVPANFKFKLTPSLKLGYMSYGVKRNIPLEGHTPKQV